MDAEKSFLYLPLICRKATFALGAFKTELEAKLTFMMFLLSSKGHGKFMECEDILDSAQEEGIFALEKVKVGELFDFDNYLCWDLSNLKICLENVIAGTLFEVDIAEYAEKYNVLED